MSTPQFNDKVSQAIGSAPQFFSHVADPMIKRLSVWMTAAMVLVDSAPTISRADEQLFRFVRGAETLPKGHSERYQSGLQFPISPPSSTIALWVSSL